MSELLKINVNEHTEKKNGLSYLSWAWAWAEVLKIDPQATWAPMFNGPQGSESPWFSLPDGSMLVGVSVVIKGHAKQCMLPVMDHRNKAIKNPDAFAVNTALMRCLAKCIAMHGLGLYIYAGEDLPEGDDAPKHDQPKDVAHSGPAIAFSQLSPDWQAWITDLARDVESAFESSGPAAAQELIDQNRDQMQAEHIAALWSKLNSKTRSSIKALKQAA